MARRFKHTVQVTEEEQVQLRSAAKERGYLNPMTFIRAAIRKRSPFGRSAGISPVNSPICCGVRYCYRRAARP